MPKRNVGPASQTQWLNGLKRGGGRAYVLAVAAPLLAGILLVIQAYVLARVLGLAIIEGVPPAALVPGIVLIGALMLVRTGLGVLGQQGAVIAVEKIKLDLRQHLFGDVMGRHASWLDGRSSGALAAGLIEQVEALEGFVRHFYPAMIQAAILPLAFAVIVLPFDWVAAGLFFVSAPLIPLFMALVGWGVELATARQARALSRLSGRFADRLGGLLTLKLFGRETIETEAIHAASEALRVRTLKVLGIAFLSSAVLEFFAALGVAGVALYVGLSFLGLIAVPGTALNFQTGLFVLLLAPEIYQPLRLLAAHYHDRAGAKAAVGEFLTQFGALPDTTSSGAPEPCERPQLRVAAPPEIRARGLTIRAPRSGAEILTHAGFEIAPGTHVALLGESGIGKSSLIEVLARLRPYEGTITLAGLPLEEIAEAQLRGDMAFLPQRPHLFEGSIADNIRVGRRDAAACDIEAAAENAGVMAFARATEAGLETEVGEGGLGLSGGEIQRIALARVYIRDCGLILLDEPTAHLDKATEHIVIDNLVRFAANRTVLVATHSEALAARMGKIWRIKDGRLETEPARQSVLGVEGAP